jgi:hypothetical protein
MDCSISSRERFPSAKLPRDLAERKIFRQFFREISANDWRKNHSAINRARSAFTPASERAAADDCKTALERAQHWWFNRGVS